MNAALIAVGVFLALYAVVTLFRGRDRDGRYRRQSLGCGFTLLAGMVWGWALGRYLGDRSAGFRLALGLVLLLPVLATLTQPGRRAVLPAIVLLVAAVLLAAPVLPKLRQQLRPSESAVTAEELEDAVAELERRIDASREYAQRLQRDRENTAERLRRLDLNGFDAVAADETGYLLLQELGDTDRLLEQTRARLDTFRRDRDRVEVAARRVRRLSDAEAATGESVSRAELERVLEDRAPRAADTAPVSVETHVERDRLRALYEREFGSE